MGIKTPPMENLTVGYKDQCLKSIPAKFQLDIHRWFCRKHWEKFPNLAISLFLFFFLFLHSPSLENSSHLQPQTHP